MKKLSNREVVMLICLGVIVVVAGYYLFLFQPLQIKLADASTELENTELLLDSSRAKESEGLEVKKNLAANEVVWNAINEKLPEGLKDTDIIYLMADARTKHRIEDRFLEYQISSISSVRENILNMVNVEVTVTAEYNTVMSFIKTFTENENLTCRIVDYSASVSNLDGTPLNSVITAKFRMQVLYRVPAEERAAAEAAAAAAAK